MVGEHRILRKLWRLHQQRQTKGKRFLYRDPTPEKDAGFMLVRKQIIKKGGCEEDIITRFCKARKFVQAYYSIVTGE